MAGLSAHETDQLKALLELRRRLSFRRFKGRPQEAFLTIVFLLLALPMPLLLAFLTGTLYARLPAPWDAEVLALVLTLLWLVWLFAPLFGASLNETPDLPRLLAFPVRRVVLIASTLLGAVFDYSAFLSLPFLLVAWISWIGDSAFMASVALLVAGAHLIVAGQLCGTLMSGIAHSRRFRDFVTVAGSLLVLGFWWFNMRSNGVGATLGDLGQRAMDAGFHPLDALQWTPPGACARAIERATAGEPLEAMAWLTGSALALGIMTIAWWRALERVTTQGEFSFGAARRRRRDRAPARSDTRRSVPLLRGSVVTIARTDLRLMWRSPRRRIATLQGFMMPVIFGVIWFSDSRLSGTLLAMAPAMCLAMVGVFGFTNVIAQDGRGVATIFLSPLDRADFFRGKALAFSAVTILPAAVLCTIVALRVPLQPGVVAALLGAGAYMVSIGTSASMSARFAIRQPDDDGKTRPPGSSAAGWIFAFVQPVLVGVIFAPVWIPVLLGLIAHRNGVATAASVAGLAYGGLVFHLAVRDAGRALLAREHEMFQTLELGRTA